MLAYFNKWKKIDDLPPITDEIYFQKNQNIQESASFQVIKQQSLQGDENILIFLDLKEFGIQELQTEVIEMSQIIEEFMKRIFQKYFSSIDTNNIYMMKDGILLEKKQKFNFCGFQSNSIIKFKKTSHAYPKEWIIYIKTLTGKTIPIKIKDGGMSINQLMEAIQEKEGIPPSEQKIIFAGQQLKNQRYLFEYNIKPNDTLHLVLRLCSGCFPGNAPIKLFDGGTKIIKEIELGDLVMCYDFKQKQFKQSTVLFKKISNEKQKLIEIIFENARIVCTPNHPVYTQAGWKALEPHPNFYIEKLSATDLIFDSNERFINIVQINQVKETEIVYNITTEYPNNFIAFEVLVHNIHYLSVEFNEIREEFEILPSLLVQNLKVILQKKKEYL